MTMSFVRLTNDKYGSTGLGLLVPTLVNTITDLWNTCSWYMYYLLGSKRVPVLQYLHIRLTFDHFWATRPKSHSTISIIACFLLWKYWYWYLCICIFDSYLIIFWATHQPNSHSTIWYSQWDDSTNLVLVHSLLLTLLTPTLYIPFWPIQWVSQLHK